MKFKLLYILLISAFMLGCSNKQDYASKVNTQLTIQTRAEVAYESLRVISSNTTLKKGDIGYITIQGKPRTKYTLRSTFQVGNRVVEVNQWRITGNDGKATFNWVVSSESHPGTRDIIIYAAGESLSLSHTVLP